MPTDATYFRGVYKPQGDNKLVVGSLGRISAAFGSTAEAPTTGTLGVNVVSATLTGHDWAGSIVVVGGATAVAAGTALCVVTFSVPRTTAPLVFVAPQSANAPGAFSAVATVNGWTLYTVAAFAISATVTVAYHLIDIE